MVKEVLVLVVEGLIKRIVVGSLQLFEGSGKTFHTISHCFLKSGMRLSFWFTWKGKTGKGCRGVYWPTSGKVCGQIRPGWTMVEQPVRLVI